MKFFALAAAAAVGFSGAAIAGPAVMTDAQMDNVVAGVSYLYEKKNDKYKIYDFDVDTDDPKNSQPNNPDENNRRGWTYADVSTGDCLEVQGGTCTFDAEIVSFSWDVGTESWVQN